MGGSACHGSTGVARRTRPLQRKGPAAHRGRPDLLLRTKRRDRGVPRLDGLAEGDEHRFQATAEELLDRIMKVADNAGTSNEHPARNYLAVPHREMYAQGGRAHTDNNLLTLSKLDLHASVARASSWMHLRIHEPADRCDRQHLTRVDVAEELTFSVTRLLPYYEQ